MTSPATGHCSGASIGAEGQAWDVERSGDLFVAGDGPWIVATRETWTDRFSRDEGARLLVIVDEDGTPKIAGYHFVAVMYDVVPDWGD